MVLSSTVGRATMRRRGRILAGLAIFWAGIFLLAADDVRPVAVGDAAEKPAAERTSPPRAADGRASLLRVPLPLVGNADTQIIRATKHALEKMAPEGERPVLVLEFASSQNQTGQGSDFERALKLARFLSSREASAAKTVAYIPRALKGHAVLVAMACEEIVMAPEGQFGEAGIDEPGEEGIDPTILSGYREIANRRRTIPAEVALGMLDKNVEVLKVETEISPEFVLATELDALKAKHTVQSEKVLKRPGQLALFSGREARELGFVKYLAADRDALAKALSLPTTELEDDPSLVGDWRPVQIAVKGPINAAMIARVQRTIDDQIHGQNANFICLWIDSPGGSLVDSMNLAGYLADADRSKVRTVAYVPVEARADAALIALACDQLIMRPEAVLGGEGAPNLSREDIQLAHDTLRELLTVKKSRSWSLAAALVDPDLRVFHFAHRPDGRVDYFCDAELQSQVDPNTWTRGEEVTKAGQPLQLAGDKAHELGLARQTVSDFAGFKEMYGLEDDLVLAEPTWADYLIDALAAPAVAWLLLLIGGAALYAELQAPGIGVGGFVAGVCFLLYFWSKHLDGTAGWLEIMLFVGGVCCILLELFVLPGAAIFGLGGGLLVIASLVLASQTFILPHNAYQVSQLQNSLLGLAGAGVGIVIAAMVMRRYLPRTPFFSHVMLEPPSDAELEDLAHRESIVDLDHLLGHRGVATTQLTPSGKARFDNELVDVIADGEVIGRGSKVVVVAVQGNRVVVRSDTGYV
jgi:membrane-bound serine protease (ClpP class)